MRRVADPSSFSFRRKFVARLYHAKNDHREVVPGLRVPDPLV